MELHVKSKKYNDADVLQVKEDLALKSEEGTKLKSGYYAYDGDNMTFNYIGDEVPDGYSGMLLELFDGAIYFGYFENGGEVNYAGLEASQIIINDNGEEVNFSLNGVNKLNFNSLTFSIAHLDVTLRQLIEDAISSGDPVACSQAQWNVINEHLANCLYFYHSNYTMIKVLTMIDRYNFGNIVFDDTGATVEFIYDTQLQELQVIFKEI